jgi:hypothetical protein
VAKYDLTFVMNTFTAEYEIKNIISKGDTNATHLHHFEVEPNPQCIVVDLEIGGVIPWVLFSSRFGRQSNRHIVRVLTTIDEALRAPLQSVWTTFLKSVRVNSPDWRGELLCD